MNDAGIPADLRKKLNAELEQFNAQTTQMLTDKSASCVRRNASADEMAEELLAVFNKAAKKLSGDIDGAYMQASWYYLLHQFAKAGYREFRHVVEHKAGLCETCLSLSEKTFTLEELVQQELLPPLPIAAALSCRFMNLGWTEIEHSAVSARKRQTGMTDSCKFRLRPKHF